MKRTDIIIDCERMKYPHTGLYHYCYNLGRALINTVDNSRERLRFFLPPKEHGVFGSGQNYIHQHSWNKLILPSLAKNSIWHSTSQGSAYFPKRRKMPVVLTIHDINIMHNQNKSESKKNAAIKALEKRIGLCSHITFISSFTLNDVKQFINLDGKPVSVIYNGCNIQEIEKPVQPSFVPDVPYYFTLGTIMEKKNFHVLPALLEGNNHLLVIAGIAQSKEYKERVIKEATKHGVEKRVVFTGAVTENDKQWYLKNCKAFFFPSLTEGFGLPVVEAMHFGVPVFLSNLTSLPEIGGDVCYYFDSFEKGAMKETVKKGLRHYETNNPAQAIKQRASLFNWASAARKYMDVYRSLM